MADNLIFLLNKLSYQIVTQELEKEKGFNSRRKDEKLFKKCVARLRQKGCDALLNKTTEPLPEDPCITDYGGNWNPMTLIIEYGRELKSQGALRCGELLLSCASTLEEKQYDNLNEILKVLLMLKTPFDDSSRYSQNEMTLNGSEFLSKSLDSFSLLNGDYSKDLTGSSFKRALQYEESWTKTFDSQFQVLGEYSKKNLLTPDKVSLDFLFIAKSINKNQSRTNSFVLTDFFSEKNCKSENNLFDYSSTYLNESTFLDSFVDTPITHKLPSIILSQKYSSRIGFLENSSEKLKKKLNELDKKESFISEKSSNEKRSGGSEGVITKESSGVPSVIELKRGPDYGHSFSVMYKKSQNYKSEDANEKSNESLLKSLKRVPWYSNSKEIVLGLWEQEQKLIKEFRPDLVESFPKLRMISLVEFIVDVKYLLTGVNSATFHYNTEIMRFHMEYGTCLEDVTPESLFHFSEEFLDIGNSYVWLCSSASEIGKSFLDSCTTISQEFWKSVFEFLELHYSVILEIPLSATLMMLKSSIMDLHEMICTLAEICKVSKPSGSLPEGGELLTYLLQVAEKVSKQCIINIIFGILQNCCNVYLMCILQTWMFKGQLEKQSSQFFVDCRRQKVNTKGRLYYNSFYIAEEKIPSFLRGYEESIFNCGKSIHFLKLFNPEDKFCQFLEKSEYPKMRLCLSDVELERLEKDFKEYENKVIEICGESISIKTIREEEKEKERCYQEYIKECKNLQERQRELARLKELEVLKAKKDLQNKLLNDQLNFLEAEKERKKQEEREENAKFEDEVARVSSMKEVILKEEKGIIKDYYDDLLKTLEEQLQMAEARKENLKRILTANLEKDQEILDVINDNKTDVGVMTNDNERDEEGNISGKLDVNSNSSQAEKVSESESDDSEMNIVFDENLNPSNPPIEKKAVKSVSFRTVAAEEAKNNKLKILRSEFGLEVRKERRSGRMSEAKLEAKPEESMTALQRNRKRVLESEYDILRSTSEHVPLRNIPSKVEIVKENSLKAPLYRVESNFVELDEDNQEEDFKSVELSRKAECTDFENSSTRSVNKIFNSESLGSVITPSTDLCTEVGASRTCEDIDLKATSTSKMLNENYQNALMRDLEVFHHKLSYQDIFCHLKGAAGRENETLPCTDFMKFQRYMRKSVLIPLKIQEKLANDALLKHLLKGENLLSHLNSLRAYFFLNDGEFGRSFTYNAFRSLAKCTEPQQFFERSNLSNIVNDALNYTIHNCDPNSQNLSFQIVQMPPYLNHASHDVLSPFELSYKVEWPLNIILTEKALSKYKMVFRFLLKLKRINWTLNENFLCLNSHFKNRNINGKKLVCSPHYHKIQIYRHAITQVMITLDDYIFCDGVQFPWLFFLKDLEATENIDHLYQKHVRYIKDVLTRCFLSKNSEDLLDCIHNLIELALKFHYTAKSSVMEISHGKYIHPKFQVLKSTFSEFCVVIKTFLKTLKEKISSNQVLKSHYILIEKFDLKLT